MGWTQDARQKDTDCRATLRCASALPKRSPCVSLEPDGELAPDRDTACPSPVHPLPRAAHAPAALRSFPHFLTCANVEKDDAHHMLKSGVAQFCQPRSNLGRTSESHLQKFSNLTTSARKTAHSQSPASYGTFVACACASRSFNTMKGPLSKQISETAVVQIDVWRGLGTPLLRCMKTVGLPARDTMRAPRSMWHAREPPQGPLCPVRRSPCPHGLHPDGYNPAHIPKSLTKKTLF